MIKDFSLFEANIDLDPLGEEVWDDERIFITLYRAGNVFSFSVYRAVIGEMIGHRVPLYICDRMIINGGNWEETIDVLEINDLVNDRYKVDRFFKSAQSIILPPDTPKDYIMDILKEVYERLRPDYEKEFLKMIELYKRHLERIKDFDSMVKYDL
jgi:hypothetical protein